mmetsp:Transcript_943/g.1137  ORF Transcript_943/g.1137 Transcript_943/m.1137 type:complete len:157 (-) Transcript_943:230-700(-)
MPLSLIESCKEAVCGSTLPKFAELSPTHCFLIFQGILYTVMGSIGVLAPSVYNKAFFFPEPFTAEEAALWRPIGLMLTLIGYFYIQGGRSNSYHFATVTIFDRLLIVPPGLGILYYLGTPREAVIPFVILDPILALLTHRSLAKHFHGSNGASKTE